MDQTTTENADSFDSKPKKKKNVLEGNFKATLYF